MASHAAWPSPPRPDPDIVLDEDDRWTLLRRCLTDEEMPLDARAAAALVLLFGLPLSRIVNLTAAHLQSQDGADFLNLDRHPLLLPPRLAGLLRQLVETPRTRATLNKENSQQSWLFPGLVPGRPASTTDIGGKLRRHNIYARKARNAALFALAADLPAAVLADLLGMHTTTAVYWGRLAKRDWDGYIAARAVSNAPEVTIRARPLQPGP